ncbi:hypothetical protein [Streptomyces sp. NPDC058086]|uniref:hypothetical protein n=1 Tax=Streptomyces sp. NPDC058086 TaxID=3346334 RepID=UPI0036E83772
MSHQTALAATEDRRRCTGESHQSLRSLVSPAGEALPIPAARHPEQAELEAAVFLATCKIGGVSRDPLGIVSVRPEPELLGIRMLAEPYVIRYWADMLLPRSVADDSSDPHNRVSGVAGLRYRHERGGICLYRPGTPARILLTGFNPRWWERVTDLLRDDYQLLQDQSDWSPDERATHTAASAFPVKAAPIFSPLLRRIRATAGPGEINATDAWSSMGGFRLEVTDGPPCPDLVRFLGDGPTGLGWEVDHKTCTCLCDHVRGGCNIDFRDPATGCFVYYSNGKWGRTNDERHRSFMAAANHDAFAR